MGIIAIILHIYIFGISQSTRLIARKDYQYLETVPTGTSTTLPTPLSVPDPISTKEDLPLDLDHPSTNL